MSDKNVLGQNRRSKLEIEIDSVNFRVLNQSQIVSFLVILVKIRTFYAVLITLYDTNESVTQIKKF